MMTSWAIRKAKLQDVPAILSLWQDADATPSVTDNVENLEKTIGHPTALVLLAEARDAIIGSVIGTFDGWRGNIYRLAVHPAYRRKGIARSLVLEAEDWMAQQGASRITALVEREHPWATGFWDAQGYQRDHRMIRYVRTSHPKP